MKQLKNFLLRHEMLIIILCLTVFVRLPSLLEPYWYGDEGIYLTLGQGVRQGLTLFRDIHDNKPPFIYLLSAICGSLFWFRFLLLIWQLGTVTLFYILAKKLINPNRSSSLLPRALVIFSTLLFAMLPVFAEGNIANGEIFMILPILAGMNLLWHAHTSKRTSRLLFSALAGLFFALAFLIKVPAVFDAIAAGVFFFLIPFKGVIRRIFTLSPWVYALAFVIPILFSIFYYSVKGAGQPYLRAALLQNVGYLSSWKTGSQSSQNLAQTGLKNRALATGGVTLGLIVASPLVSSEVLLVTIWFIFALFGALLSERPYPHYLIEVIPPLALALPLLFMSGKNLLKSKLKKTKIKNLLGVLMLGGCLAALISSVIKLKFWYYPVTPYYTNYLRFMTGQISKDKYYEYFDKTLPEQYKLATHIRLRTTPKDRIFIWGDLPTMYALTRRLPPGRYTSAYHIKDFGGFEETTNAIQQNLPAFIWIDRRVEPFPGLASILDSDYILSYSSNNFLLYRKSGL